MKKEKGEMSKLTKVSLIINAIVLLIILVGAFRCFVDYNLLKRSKLPKYASLHYVSEEKEVRSESGKILLPKRTRAYYNGIFYDIYLYLPESINGVDINYGINSDYDWSQSEKVCTSIEMKLFGKTIEKSQMINPDAK